ncbi:tripartite tricarboxylate transporter substrate binding protein [Ramlibacter sp. AW1]|uniref:Tripartite tricarboxylate transporter substrate binding protein n=1 Tax=Ramlibacter aurantiacus TaxID=2801330 RepID=A0A936ZLE2_9BURK|nr:tripartite tricarboxylate transporter substrate binding protein [Ramlibacter aurantiacus]MBL0421952.1 tripartite tricarboxylate transporter substrate binding protein [Ramlibacter aurantiacus]
MTMKNKLAFMALAMTFAVAPLQEARADWKPAKPIRLVVPFAAGGGADLIARKLAEGAKQHFDQPVIVENRPGAGTAVAAQFVARSPADGYTLLLATSTTLCVNPILRSNLPYKADDFAPVAVLESVPFMLVVPKDSPAGSLRELVQMGQQRQGQVFYGTLGIGSSNHVLGGTLAKRANVELSPVHYNSGAPAMLALMRNDIQFYFDGISTSVPRVKNGELRGLAVTSRERVPAMPNLPTVAEAGYPDLSLSVWYGVVAPAGTPADVVQALNTVFNKVMATPDIVASMAAGGTRPLPISPAQFGKLIADDSALWKKAIEPLNLKLE